MSCKDQFRRS